MDARKIAMVLGAGLVLYSIYQYNQPQTGMLSQSDYGWMVVGGIFVVSAAYFHPHIEKLIE